MAGPGGYAAALYGASAGLNIAMIEKDKVGGTCLHVGASRPRSCSRRRSVRRAVGAAAEFGVTVDAPTLDFGVSQDRKQSVIDQLVKGLSSLLKRARSR